jgi:hypothetical protein
MLCKNTETGTFYCRLGNEQLRSFAVKKKVPVLAPLACARADLRVTLSMAHNAGAEFTLGTTGRTAATSEEVMTVPAVDTLFCAEEVILNARAPILFRAGSRMKAREKVRLLLRCSADPFLHFGICNCSVHFFVQILWA